MVGAGVLEGELRALVAELDMPNVTFVGFINQSELPGIRGGRRLRSPLRRGAVRTDRERGDVRRCAGRDHPGGRLRADLIETA